MSIKNIISSLDFFSKLNDKDIEQLCLISSIYNYAKDYILHYEKQDSQFLLFLIYGHAKAYKIDKHENEIFLYNIFKQSLISEISNLDSTTLTSFSNISLLEDSQILSVDYKKFKELFLDNYTLHYEFTNEILLRSNRLSSLINREFIFDSVSKVTMLLDSNLKMFNKLKRTEVSLMLHIQPETLSRVLNRLKRNNIIESKLGKITVVDNKALKEIFEEF
ncbi:MAG: transcriptional regulator [Sulfurimonas sp.]|nr:MAG: transcriptional regulator [Sulfurimonas sp.]